MAAKDGALLAGAVSGERVCRVCAVELGTEPWWVVPGQFPLAEHSRCRDWKKHAFPYNRHIDELRKLWRKLSDPSQVGARMVIEAAGKALGGISADWPAGGASGVSEAELIVARVRASLQAGGVDASLLQRL